MLVFCLLVFPPDVKIKFNMCFALPLKVVTCFKKQATMEDGRKVNLAMVGSAKKGDWLLVQSNLAVSKLTKKEAQAMRKAIKEVSNEIRL